MRRWLLTLVVGLMTTTSAFAQQLPSQIRIVVPLVAGSSLDARCRVIADALGQRLGKRVIVENRPGAGGTIGAAYVAKSKPDGATLMMTNNSHVIAPHVYGNLGYEPLRDLMPVIGAYSSGMVILAHPQINVTSLKELVAASKQQHTLNYGSSGTGSLPHLAMELFLRTAGIRIVHVPYRGDAQAMTDLIGGRISLMMSGYPTAMSQVRAGKLRALAVTSSKRAPVFPAVPTIAETYPDYVLDTWAMVFAPAGTPPGLVEHLHQAFKAAIATPQVRANYEATGAEVDPRTPAQLGTFLQQESERYRKVVKELDLKPE
ncbi:MAG TPA: tripartite tricarboxylate transporter substrate binding protein [Burkholderiales bacterium]|nr:tripartite tricarboxylate transporter substrate binding protein [Burkholderiales bacterium]